MQPCQDQKKQRVVFVMGVKFDTRVLPGAAATPWYSPKSDINSASVLVLKAGIKLACLHLQLISRYCKLMGLQILVPGIGKKGRDQFEPLRLSVFYYFGPTFECLTFC